MPSFVVAPTGNTGNNTLPIVPRTSITTGNLALCAIAIAAGTVTVVPSGWTLVKATDAFNTDDRLYVYAHTVSAGDPTSWQFTISTTARWTTIAFELSGADTTTIVDVSSQQANAASTAVTAPGIDPTNTNDLLIWFGAWGPTLATLTAPSGFTIPTNGTKTAASNIASGGAYKVPTDGSPTGDVVGTLSAAVGNGAILLAILDASPVPEGGGGDTTGTVSAGTVAVTGGTVTASAGASVDATGAVTGQTIAVTGAMTGQVGTGTEYDPGSGGVGSPATVPVIATTGQGDTAALTGQTIAIAGGTVTGSAGAVVNATGTVTGKAIPVSGGPVAGTFDNTVIGVVSGDTVPVTGGLIVAVSGGTQAAIVIGGSIVTMGSAVTGSAGQLATGTVSVGTVALSGALIQAVDDLTFYGEFTGRAALVAAFTGDATFND